MPVSDSRLGVIEHLDQEEDERNYNEKGSVVAALQEKIAPARDRVKDTEGSLRTRRSEFDAARQTYSQASAAMLQVAEKCKALTSELDQTGFQGTDDELALATQARETADTSAQRLGVEHEETNNSFIEQRTNLRALEERVNTQRQDASHQLSALRYERRAQRELDRIVSQLGLRGRIDSDLNRQQGARDVAMFRQHVQHHTKQRPSCS